MAEETPAQPGAIKLNTHNPPDNPFARLFHFHKEVSMYINTFKYTPADVDCKLCTEYVKKFGCTACGCPWMAERIEAGVVGYAEVVRQMFPHDKRLMARLEPLIRDFPGMLWKDERHRQRMEGVKIHLGHSKRRDTPAFFAVMFLFTSDEDIYRRAGNCLCRRGAEFDYARLHEISPHDYTLYIAARGIYTNAGGLTTRDLADAEVVDAAALRMIVNALLIARYGCAVLDIHERGRKA
jgi:hypothetical protein